MRKTGIISMAMAAALVASAGLAQTSMQGTGGTRDKGQGTGDQGTATTASSASSPDKRFIEEAARGGMAEVALGQLAAQKATSPDVKSFAQMMVDDHSKANDELKSIAAQKGVTLPSDLGAKEKAEQSRLEKLSGAEFDRAYVRAMVRDHKKDVAQFERESKSGRDPAVKDFASKTLSKLQTHLQHAESLAGTSGQEGSKKGNQDPNQMHKGHQGSGEGGR